MWSMRNLAGLAAIGSSLLLGCGGNTPSAESPSEQRAEGDVERFEQAHGGPHGGAVFNLGDGRLFKAELVEDEMASTVSIYILEPDLEPIPIMAGSLTLDVNVDGETKSYQLDAVDLLANRTTPHFLSRDKKLFTALYDENAGGTLHVKIEGDAFTGRFSQEPGE